MRQEIHCMGLIEYMSAGKKKKRPSELVNIAETIQETEQNPETIKGEYQ